MFTETELELVGWAMRNERHALQKLLYNEKSEGNWLMTKKRLVVVNSILAKIETGENLCNIPIGRIATEAMLAHCTRELLISSFFPEDRTTKPIVEDETTS